MPTRVTGVPHPGAHASALPTPPPTPEGIAVGAVIMLGTLFGLIVLIFALVLRFDPEARDPSKDKRPNDA